MKLKDKYEGNLLGELLDKNLVKEIDEWGYYSSVPLNGIIATGWLSNDDIIMINGGSPTYRSQNSQMLTRPSVRSVSTNEIPYLQMWRRIPRPLPNN